MPPHANQYERTPDADLLRQFRRHHDEQAFAELVLRHGPLVMGICRQVLRHSQDAEDAFQSTFVALALRSRSIKLAGSLASWLYKVAYRTAMRAARHRQRNRCEAMTEDVRLLDDPLESIHRQSLRLAVHEEVSKLPAAYRGPVVLCYLQGKTRQEAADALGCTDASIKAKLARARRMLRVCFVRRGITLSVALAAAGGGCAFARESLGQALVWKTVAVSTSSIWSATFRLFNAADLINRGRTCMSIPMTGKLAAAATTALGIMILGLAWMSAAAPPERQPSRPRTVRMAEATAQRGAGRVDSMPVQFGGQQLGGQNLRVQNLGWGQIQFVNDAADNGEADDLRHQFEYLRKKARAYFMLRDVELERAQSAGDDLSRREARARAQIHEAEAEKLSREAKQLQAKLSDVENFFLLQLSEGYRLSDAAAIPPAPCCRKNNLAYGRSVTASSQEEIINNFAQLAVDGDLSTRWCAEDSEPGQWIQVDLGAPRDVQKIRIHWEMMNTKYEYKIETSEDGENWTKVVDTSKAPKRGHMPEHDLNAPGTRYIRITFLGSDRGFWGSIREIEVSDGELSPPPTEAWEKVRPDADPSVFLEYLGPGT